MLPTCCLLHVYKVVIAVGCSGTDIYCSGTDIYVVGWLYIVVGWLYIVVGWLYIVVGWLYDLCLIIHNIPMTNKNAESIPKG